MRAGSLFLRGGGGDAGEATRCDVAGASVRVHVRSTQYSAYADGAAAHVRGV